MWVQLRHPNVLPFLGLDNMTFRALCMVSPWMKNGNLSLYLRDHNQGTTSRLKYQWVSNCPSQANKLITIDPLSRSVKLQAACAISMASESCMAIFVGY